LAIFAATTSARTRSACNAEALMSITPNKFIANLATQISNLEPQTLSLKP
jgi:hypothetical protein